MSEAEVAIVLLSLKVAFVAIVCALPVAFVVAWVLARNDFPGKTLLQAVVMLPLVVPPVVTGYTLLVWFGSQGWAGSLIEQLFGIRFAFRWTGAALAAGTMAFPMLVRPIRLSLENIDTGLLDAAETLGARRMLRFATITLPLALPGVLAGAMLGFAKALGEFGATITFVSNIPGETQTLSLAVYSLLQSPGGESGALRLIVFSIVVALGAVVMSEWLQRRLRRRGAG